LFIFSEELCEDELDVLLYGFEFSSALFDALLDLI